MRKKIIAGNWKMNKTPSEAAVFAAELAELADCACADVVLCVPFIDIPAAVKAVEKTGISIGAQNMHYEDSGAFTGEISAKMLTDAGVGYVVLGHSERREYFAETDETVNKKVKKAFENGLIPIICVGERLAQREWGVTFELIRMQAKIALRGLGAEQAASAVIAYEPIWAIGTGVSATSEQAEEACAAIRRAVSELYDAEVSENLRVLYGGSVNAANAPELFAMPDIDGALVGGASLKREFIDIVNAAHTTP